MKLKRLSESLSESLSDSPVFQAKLGGYGTKNVSTIVEIYNEPMEIHNCSVVGGNAEWTLDIEYKSWGIQLGPRKARLVSLTVLVETEDEETYEIQEREISAEESQFNWDAFKTEIHQFPMDLESIELDMRNSMDPNLWKVTLHVGHIID